MSKSTINFDINITENFRKIGLIIQNTFIPFSSISAIAPEYWGHLPDTLKSFTVTIHSGEKLSIDWSSWQRVQDYLEWCFRKDEENKAILEKLTILEDTIKYLPTGDVILKAKENFYSNAGKQTENNKTQLGSLETQN